MEQRELENFFIFQHVIEKLFFAGFLFSAFTDTLHKYTSLLSLTAHENYGVYAKCLSNVMQMSEIEILYGS